MREGRHEEALKTMVRAKAAEERNGAAMDLVCIACSILLARTVAATTTCEARAHAAVSMPRWREITGDPAGPERR